MALTTTGSSPKALQGERRGKVATTQFTPSGSVKASSRRASAKRGHTMKGGSFPIENTADLARAKHDVGRAKDPAAARAWINKRAKQLGAAPLGGKDARKKANHNTGGFAHHAPCRGC
jgi:hypothetical protein